LSTNATNSLTGSAPSAVSELQNLRNDLISLARAVVALQQRVAEAEVNATEVRPQLTFLKVHSESLPQALRELKRSEAAIKKRLDTFDFRLRALENEPEPSPSRG
jgi:septal ring factor EnvC (AmiA/AmiB activator)